MSMVREVKKILGDLQSTHWGKRIVAAARRVDDFYNDKSEDPEFFTEEDKKDASAWPTCACGKMYARKPFKRVSEQFELTDSSELFERYSDCPVDTILGKLGSDFYGWIAMGNCIGAAKTMREIEKRGTVLLGEIDGD